LYNISKLPITTMNNQSNSPHQGSIKPGLEAMVLLGLLALSSGIVFGQAAPATPSSSASVSPAADSTKPVGGTALPVDPKTYIIGVGDELKIEVFREPDLTRNAIVRTDGKITMTLLDDIQAEGLTPERLKEHITAGLTGPIANPTVTISVVGLNSKKFYINGMVNRPGPYFLTAPITIFDALNAAGGFRDFANLKDIKIIRGTKRLTFNYNDYLKGKNTSGNIYLETGDTVYIK
jgi:polysaccharide export outer membrane protein